MKTLRRQFIQSLGLIPFIKLPKDNKEVFIKVNTKLSNEMITESDIAKMYFIGISNKKV